MKVLNIHQAKTHLSRLVEEAVDGQTIVVAKAGKALVQLVPVSGDTADRPLGLLAGEAQESADCWTPDAEVEEWFYGSDKVGSPRVAE